MELGINRRRQARRIAALRTGQDPKPWTPSPELIVQAPYRWTRNPMYVGLTCILVGLGLALNYLWFSLLAPIALLGAAVILQWNNLLPISNEICSMTLLR